MSEQIKLPYKPQREWRGDYRGVRWTMCVWYGPPILHYPERETWNYYLWIPEAQLPEGVRANFDAPAKTTNFGLKDRVIWNYHDDSVALIHGLEWHGGVTYYRKHVDADGSKMFEIGCDYAHSWDEGITYHENVVLRDVAKTIDALWDAVPDLRTRCAYCGEYQSAERHIVSEQACPECIDSKREREAERAQAKGQD